MPKQMKGGSFEVRAGRQPRLSQKVTVTTREVRFRPGHPVPVQEMMEAITAPGTLSESEEERIQQST